jgi:CheY-like chemotaxis protein
MTKVLIVDDDPLLREALLIMLQGFEVTQAAEGSAALREFRRTPDAIVLCDIFMEGKEGLETIRDLRQAHPGAKIIAMTAEGTRTGIDVLDFALQDGANLTLRKPFDKAQLLEAIERVR